MDPLDDIVAAAVEGLDTPAPISFGCCSFPKMEPRSLAASSVVDSFSAPPCGVQQGWFETNAVRGGYRRI